VLQHALKQLQFAFPQSELPETLVGEKNSD
jgi:hypothetical protein